MSLNYNIVTRSANHGYALIEVLAATFIIAFGAMSLMYLQTRTMTTAIYTNQYFLASSYVHDISERIRANPSEALTYSMADYNSLGSACGQVCSDDVNAWLDSIKGENDIATIDNIKNAEGRLTVSRVVGGTSVNVLVEIRWPQDLDDGSFHEYSSTVLVNVRTRTNTIGASGT